MCRKVGTESVLKSPVNLDGFLDSFQACDPSEFHCLVSRHSIARQFSPPPREFRLTNSHKSVTEYYSDGEFGFIFEHIPTGSKAVCDMDIIVPDTTYYINEDGASVPMSFHDYAGDLIIKQLQVISRESKKPFPGTLWQNILIETATVLARSNCMSGIHMLPSNLNRYFDSPGTSMSNLLSRNYDRPATRLGFARKNEVDLHTCIFP